MCRTSIPAHIERKGGVGLDLRELIRPSLPGLKLHGNTKRLVTGKLRDRPPGVRLLDVNGKFGEPQSDVVRRQPRRAAQRELRGHDLPGRDLLGQLPGNRHPRLQDVPAQQRDEEEGQQRAEQEIHGCDQRHRADGAGEQGPYQQEPAGGGQTVLPVGQAVLHQAGDRTLHVGTFAFPRISSTIARLSAPEYLALDVRMSRCASTQGASFWTSSGSTKSRP